MRAFKLLTLLALVAICNFTRVAADKCSKGSISINGDHFCQPVKAVKYTNVGFTGSYQEVTAMHADGTCSRQAKHFSGRLAPLDEELSLHIRGPANIKQFAAYAVKTDVAKREHVHHNIHKRAKMHVGDVKRDVITATIDGQVVTWTADTADYYVSSHASPANTMATVYTTICSTVKPTATSEVGNLAIENTANPNPATATSASSLSDDAKAEGTTTSKNSYKRIGYYHAASQTVDNLVFLGNYGGQGSGVFDFVFGNSLSYINSEGNAGAPSPQILSDTFLPSRHEVSILTNKKCGAECGFVRPGAVAYHGFGGDNKIFLLEIGMPLDGDRGFQGDTPAVWFLNAKIPRTAQYYNCSCWRGCGEVDVAEALSPGSTYLKSTVHDDNPGGDSDYFERPTTGTNTYAMVFREDTIYFGVIPNHKFPTKLSGDDLNKMIADNEAVESDFQLARSG